MSEELFVTICSLEPMFDERCSLLEQRILKSTTEVGLQEILRS